MSPVRLLVGTRKGAFVLQMERAKTLVGPALRWLGDLPPELAGEPGPHLCIAKFGWFRRRSGPAFDGGQLEPWQGTSFHRDAGTHQ